jgi:putative effector of murein hydrolase
VTGQAYQGKPWVCVGLTALTGEAMGSCITTVSSFRDDHVNGWLMGMGEDPPG